MIVMIKTITSVLKVSTNIITRVITIRLTVILAIMSFSTFITDVILYV